MTRFGAASQGAITANAGRLPEGTTALQVHVGGDVSEIGQESDDFYLVVNTNGGQPDKVEAIDGDGNVISTWEQP